MSGLARAKLSLELVEDPKQALGITPLLMGNGMWTFLPLRRSRRRMGSLSDGHASKDVASPCRAEHLAAKLFH